MAEPAPPEQPARPFWKNPFVIAFFFGIAALTVLPFLQRMSLRAPEPLGKLPPWAMHTTFGHPIGSDSLRGKVWIAALCVMPCTMGADLSRLGKPLSDVSDKIKRVTFVVPGEGVVPVSEDRSWSVATGTPELLQRVLKPLADAYAVQKQGPGATGSVEELAKTPLLILVDQEGSIRGFWPMDATGEGTGEGNVINAARMLARHGPRP